jgi:hypothetical protein
MKEYILCTQCVPDNGTTPKDFIAENGTRKPVSPLFDSLTELYIWMSENGWESTEQGWLVKKKD